MFALVFTSENSDTSDLNFDDDTLADALDELEISSEYSTENEMDVDCIGENHMSKGGFTSISPKNVTPILVFRNFFTEEVFNLIVNQTNIYGKQGNEGIVGMIPVTGRME